MFYPGVDFWTQTEDQVALKMEAVNAREGRELVRATAAMAGLDDPADAFPRWHIGEGGEAAEPLDFSVSAQRGMVEAVERGLITGDVWRRSVHPVWTNLLAATGDIDAWREAKRRQRTAKGGGGRGG